MTNTLDKRTDSGATFSIVFGVIAFVVVLACVIWGFAIPHWRKTHPAPPSRTKWNDGSILTARRKRPPRRIFSVHPAVGPLLCGPSAAQILPTYNPRVESPFPSDMYPKPDDGRAMCVVRTNSAPVVSVDPTSNGLFTPIKRSAPEDDDSKGKHHTVPRGMDAKRFPNQSTDFGDAKEFILAVPEPLTLRPRDSSRAPTVTKYRERYSKTSTSSPSTSDKLPHPNKLFRAVQRGNVRSSLCSSTSLYVDHRESDMAAVLAAKEMSDAVDRAIQDGEERERDFRDQIKVPSGKSSSQSAVRDCENNVTALDRLRSYRSLTGNRPSRLEGPGNVKRSVIPLSTMENLHSSEEAECNAASPSPLHITSCSTALNSNETSSEHDTISTPATSPTFAPGNLQLLPCPLRPMRSRDEGIRPLPITKMGEEGKNKKDCREILDENTATVPQPLEEKYLKIARGFHRANRRKKAAPPGLTKTQKYSPSKTRVSRRSFTDIPGGVAGPNHLKSHLRASSMYSGDTDGFSLAASPTPSKRPSQVLNALIHHDGAAVPFQGRESVRDRIQEWTQRIGGLSSPPLPESSTSRPTPTFSKDDLGIKRTQEHQEQMNARPSEATETGDQDQASGPPNSEKCLGTAPGGAKWI